MPVTKVTELNERNVSGNTITFKFRAEGSINLEEVADAVMNASPPNYGYYRRRWLEKTMTQDGPAAYIVEVPYTVPDVSYVTPAGAPAPPAVPGSPGGWVLPGEDVSLPPEWSL